ncbi:crossover junction endodeoxyribonuclease RuvC [Priestia megaterium]
MRKTILAGDLSLACPAFAVMTFDSHSNEILVHKMTHVKTSSKNPLGERLMDIHQHVDTLLSLYEVDEIVVEKGFNRYAVATQQLQRVVGVFVITIYSKGFTKFAELSPTTCKKAITGDGKASKEALAEGLEKYVGKLPYKTNDESDAVGVGVAYAISKNWTAPLPN